MVRAANDDARKVYVLSFLFLVSLACAALRSVGAFDPVLHWDGVSDVAVLGLALLVIGLPSLWIAQSPGRAGYFLGASPALGIFPSLPHMPFLKDFSHLMLIVVVVAYWRPCQVGRAFRRMTPPSMLYVSFAAICVVSVITNFLAVGSVWQLKVGISSLVVVLAFALLSVELTCSHAATCDPVSNILEGFLHGALGVALIGVAVIFLLFALPYSTGAGGLGNNTVYGLGYYDRMQLMFEGPSFAGMFFVLAAGLTIYALSRGIGPRGRILGYFLQLSPWLVMASGSRVARLSLVVVLLVGLVNGSLRRTTLVVLPSAALAIIVAFNFQSLPSAVLYSLAKVWSGFGQSAEELKLMSLSGRFFVDNERYLLVQESLAFFSASSPLFQWLGHGFGVAGYSASEIPSPHQQPLDVLTEVGILGFSAYYVFMLSCMLYLLRGGPAHILDERPLRYMLAALLISLTILSAAYEIGTRGMVLVVIALALATSRKAIADGTPVDAYSLSPGSCREKADCNLRVRNI